jgi:flagellar motor switch/type III secretory pathway protein FliN
MRKRKSQDEVDEVIDQQATEMSRFFEIDLQVDLRVGETKLTVGRILDLGKEEVIKLDRPASEHVTLLVEGLPFAAAEVMPSEKGTIAHITELFEEAE